ncbi:MAG: DUF7676 family protein [Acidobacteriota bacterium]
MNASVLSPRFDTYVQHLDDAITAYSYFEPAEPVMKELVHTLFAENWQRIVVGPCLEGAVFEVRFAEAPAVRISDGYLTVDVGFWHFHLCIGPHRGTTSEELRRNRPVAKAALFERRGRGCGGGRSWGLRLWNGYGEQMTTVFLPNAHISDEQQLLRQPDWSRLELYYQLRHHLLGEPIPESFEVTAQLPFPEIGTQQASA